MAAKNKKVGIVSLGCAKNLVDSEMILATFRDTDYEITSSPSEADIIIVNTCGFIEAAKKEAIETILEMAHYNNSKLVVTGCFVERNLEELKEEIPEVDLWIPINQYGELHTKIEKMLNDGTKLHKMDPLQRVVSTPDYCAYLRISEGCNNFCAFCAIPYIRGRFVSRPYEEILEEARLLKEKGIKEISLISQDTTYYGRDFPDKKPNILDLLKALDEMGFYSIRLLYLYPDEISDELIDFIGKSRSIAHYFDIPIQCASDHLLKLMRRHGTAEGMKELFRKIKEKMPEAILRTTLISGFPGENLKDQKETIEFLNELKFDHLGVFAYSREEGTLAYNYPHQVRQSTKERRRAEIMELQRHISYHQNKTRIGLEMEGLVTGYDKTRDLYTLRSYWNAPDDIDGNIYFKSKRTLYLGDVVKVKITDAYIYDLLGEIIE
ncbi:MAG: 30S ribosomal protein S12 methylthiotransferase RimO [Bacilli bacterium]|nr:30S ribosomal protein S12 methylthiotransferase RimO [Bacilli bacterium]